MQHADALKAARQRVRDAEEAYRTCSLSDTIAAQDAALAKTRLLLLSLLAFAGAKAPALMREETACQA